MKFALKDIRSFFIVTVFALELSIVLAGFRSKFLFWGEDEAVWFS